MLFDAHCFTVDPARQSVEICVVLNVQSYFNRHCVYVCIYIQIAIKGNARELEHIRLGKLEDNPRIPSQRIAYISYLGERKKLMRHTPEF